MSAAGSPLPIAFSQRRGFTKNLPISFLMQQAVENPGVISLAAGLVDAETLPLEPVRHAVDELLSSPAGGKHALQYGVTAGYQRLRRQLREHFAALEGVAPERLGVDADQIVLTTGSQQLLSLVCETLFDPGDICLVAGPTYFVFAGNLAGVGARAITIPADEDGMCVDALASTLQQLEHDGLLPRVKLIYVVSYYDNPAGSCLTGERRRRVVELAERYSRDQRILILEDAAYRELHYDGPVFPSVWGLDESRASVIYAQTFSKTFSPGLRVGYGILPADLVSAIHDRKGNDDFGSSNFGQHVLSTVIQQGRYQSHLQQVIAGYRAKRDAMLKAADKYFGGLTDVSWRRPQGGLYVWMSLPESIPTGFDGELFRAAVQEGVMYVPGELCYAVSETPRPSHEMRLSFGVQSAEGIDLGMQRLAAAVKRIGAG